MASLFISYSHPDEAFRQRLEKHLAVLRRSGEITVFHDRRILPGDHFNDVIDENLAKADIVLLLVSADFLDSDYCYEKEYVVAVEREERGECRVIPVILKDCDWLSTPMKSLLALPTDGKPIVKWAHEDEAYKVVVDGIRTALKGLPGAASDAASAPPSRQQAGPAAAAPRSGPRSANLVVRRRFTDEDRDTFLTETFEFICRYFENSIAELGRRNAGVTGKVTQVDAHTFSAQGYLGGKKIAKCRVFRGGWGGELCYSGDDQGSNNSYNESLSVVDDEGALGMKALGMSTFRGGDRDAVLSQEGAAELFWELFVEPFQRD